MTVTQRRVRTDPNKSEPGVATEPGIKYTCDCCHIDITHTVRIKCAAKECEEVDICPSCFCEGKEIQKHKAWHDYKVVEQHWQPIFTPEWGADEELLLISGLIINGLGNWAEAASHVGTRTKEECEKHYLEVYLGVSGSKRENGLEMNGEGALNDNGKRELMPPMDRSFDVSAEDFQKRKKARIEQLRKPQALPTGTPAPLISAPTNHEVAGFMPGRLEFEHEVENDAEVAVKDFDFGLVWKYGGDDQPEAKISAPKGEEEAGGGEDDEEDKDDAESKAATDDVKVKDEPMEDPPEASTSRINGHASTSPTADSSKRDKGKQKEQIPDIEDEDELEVKLTLLDVYFSKLDKREEAKDTIFDRGLTEHKRIIAVDRKRPKDERELIQRYKVFAKLQTAQDFEILTEGLVYEQALRKRIAEMQEYRRMGITTGQEAEAYDTAKAARAGYRPLLPRERSDVLPTGARINAGQHRFLHGGAGTPPPGPTGKHSDNRDGASRIPHPGRKPPTPLNLSNAASLDLLSSEEQHLCSALRILPKPYLTIKEMYIRENERRKGLLKRRDARKMLKIDVNKSGRIFDYLVAAGLMVLNYDPLNKGFLTGMGMGMGMGKERKEGYDGEIQMGEMEMEDGGVREIRLGDPVGD